jgi:hypothetical protein
LVNPFEYMAMRALRLSRRLHISRLVWASTSTKMFTDYFKNFEKARAVRGIFGDKTEEVLKNLKVEFIWFGYMGVDNSDGHLMVNERYLNSGDRTEIYLDVVHELCHVKQWMEGKELFDPNYDYVDRPTEVEAYRYAVLEAKRLGMSNKRILAYLKTEWISPQDLQRLIKNIDVCLSEADSHSDSQKS